MTKGERAVSRHEGNLVRDNLVAALRSHRDFMDANPPAACFRDAYAADRALLARWLRRLGTGVYGSEGSPEGRAVNYRYDALERATDSFFAKLEDYFRDCR
jgi:hypothetical protein